MAGSNWQWAAPCAFAADPQRRARAGDDPLESTRIAFVLDQDSVLVMDVMLELRSETGSPAARGGSPADSAAQRDQ